MKFEMKTANDGRRRYGRIVPVDENGMPYEGEENFPIIYVKPIARKEGGGVKFRCPHCKRTHYHSAGEGHRLAHCGEDSPFYESGYILKYGQTKRTGC